VRDHPDFGRLTPHLLLLNEGQPLQTRKSQSIDQAANKVFELLSSCWVMGSRGGDVVLDHPQKSTGRNPDVLFTFNGERWGIACKALHSVHPQTVLEKLQSGVRQIQKSEAKRGFVLLSAKNIVAHDDYFRLLNLDEWRAGAEPIYRAFADHNEPFQKLRTEIDNILIQVRDAIGVETLVKLFADSKTVPAIVIWAHTVGAVVLNGYPVPTSVRTLIVGHLFPGCPRETPDC
jgi:hypothetical protein